jgi:hypothetical protein
MFASLQELMPLLSFLNSPLVMGGLTGRAAYGECCPDLSRPLGQHIALSTARQPISLPVTVDVPPNSAGACTLKLISDHGSLGELESFHAHTHSVSIVKPSIGAKIGTIPIVSRYRVLKLEGKCP